MDALEDDVDVASRIYADAGSKNSGMSSLMVEKINKNERKNKTEISMEIQGSESTEFRKALGFDIASPESKPQEHVEEFVAFIPRLYQVHLESDVDGGEKLPTVDTEVKSVGDCDDGTTNEPAGAQKHSNPGSKRKPKAQKKREQNETFRKWGQLMNQRKTHKDLWASGLLKFTVELWEDDNKLMNYDEILDLFKRNVDQLTTHISSEESKNRFFLTLIKICSMRQVPKPKFPEIMLCFENHGPHRSRITGTEIEKFIKIYEEYKV